MEAYMPFIWIGFAVIMALCEAFTTQLVSIWFFIGSVCAAITTMFTPSIPIQSAVFLGVSLITLIATRPLVKRLKAKKGFVSTNADRLIGKTGVVILEIKDSNTTGQVKVEGEIWTAKSELAPLEKDRKIKVLSISGAKLIVEPTEQ